MSNIKKSTDMSSSLYFLFLHIPLVLFLNFVLKSYFFWFNRVIRFKASYLKD